MGNPLQGFDENTCVTCANLHHGQPPCVRAQHMADRTSKVCLRAIQAPGGLCGYHAQWQHLAGLLYHAPKPDKVLPLLDGGKDWVAYREGQHSQESTINSRLIVGQLKLNLTHFMNNNEVVVEGNTRGHGLNSHMLYDPWVGAQAHYEKRGQELIALDRFAIVRAVPHDPKFHKVLDFFQHKVTAAQPAKLEFDPEGTQTAWKFDTYGSFGGGVGAGAGATGTIVLIAPNKKKYRYLYGGGGGGVSTPIPIPSGGPEEFPTVGHIQKNPDLPELSIQSFVGPCSFTDASVIPGLGLSGTILTTGIHPTSYVRYSAHIYMGGLAAGVTAGANRCFGGIKLLGPA